eukprot:Tbor_TRINITY_DN7536_c0_g1::TRINITY_DN7536_c0_g1_i1::g.935::m.935
MQSANVNDVLKQIQESGPELNQTNSAFRKLVATVGQLSTKTLEVPDEELYLILGMVTSCSVAMAARHGWNALDAACSALEKQGRGYSQSSNQCYNSTLRYRPIGSDVAAAPQIYQQESVSPQRFYRLQRSEGSAQEPEIVLSPRTARSFFTHLDALAMLTRAEFESRGGALRWVVVSDEGNVIELKPGGASIPVAYDDLPLYFRLAEPYRHGPKPKVSMNGQNGSVPPQDTHPKQHFKTITTKKAVPINKPAGYDAEAELNLFSPAHHTMGLFSPACPNQDFVEVPYTYQVPATPVPDAKLLGDETYSYLPPNVARPMVDEDIPRREQFFKNVERIIDGNITDDELNAMCLSFAVPSGTGDMIPLVKNGQLIRVTGQNSSLFIQRLRATGQYPEKSMPSPGNHVTSINGVTTIKVGDPYHNSLDNFSPTHFANDLFAPKDTTAGSIRFESSDRQEAIPEALRRSVSLAPTAWEQFVRTATEDSFFTIISQEGKEGELEGLTYCMPSSLVGKKVREHLSKRQLEDPVLDLVPQGRTIAVADIQDYRDRVAEAAEV